MKTLSLGLQSSVKWAFISATGVHNMRMVQLASCIAGIQSEMGQVMRQSDESPWRGNPESLSLGASTKQTRLTPGIPALRRVRRDSREFQASLGSIEFNLAL